MPSGESGGGGGCHKDTPNPTPPHHKPRTAPIHVPPNPQAPKTGMARIHGPGEPSPQAGLPRMEKLRARGGFGGPPGRGQVGGGAEAQLLRGAGGAVRGGGLPLPPHVVTGTPWGHCPGRELQHQGCESTGKMAPSPSRALGALGGRRCPRPGLGSVPRLCPATSVTSSNANAASSPEIKMWKSWCFGQRPASRYWGWGVVTGTAVRGWGRAC